MCACVWVCQVKSFDVFLLANEGLIVYEQTLRVRLGSRAPPSSAPGECPLRFQTSRLRERWMRGLLCLNPLRRLSETGCPGRAPSVLRARRADLWNGEITRRCLQIDLKVKLKLEYTAYIHTVFCIILFI